MNLGTLGASLVPLGPPELTARPRVWQVNMYVIMYVDRCSLHKPGADELARPRSRSSEPAPWIASWNLLQPSPQSCIPAPMHHPARAPTAPNCDCNLRVCLCCPVASEPKLGARLPLSLPLFCAAPSISHSWMCRTGPTGHQSPAIHQGPLSATSIPTSRSVSSKYLVSDPSMI